MDNFEILINGLIFQTKEEWWGEEGNDLRFAELIERICEEEKDPIKKTKFILKLTKEYRKACEEVIERRLDRHYNN